MPDTTESGIPEPTGETTSPKDRSAVAEDDYDLAEALKLATGRCPMGLVQPEDGEPSVGEPEPESPPPSDPTT
jgi:hypothetical protein